MQKEEIKFMNYLKCKEKNEQNIDINTNYLLYNLLFIYLMMFGHASFLAIFQSNNNYMPIVGAYIAFRFLIGWVEDFTRFDLNMFYLWAMIGMCYSPYFRNMSNDEFSEWLNNMVA